MKIFSSNLNGILSLLASAGVLTIFYELVSTLLSFNHKRKKERADYLITNLYCLFQHSLEIHLFKTVRTRKFLYHILNELEHFKLYLNENPKILFYLNDQLRISLDRALEHGEKFEKSNDQIDLVKFRFAFSSFSKSYFKQINRDRKTVGLPPHGYKYRAFYKMHVYKKYSALFLFIDYYIIPVVAIFLGFLLILVFVITLFLSLLNYF